MRALVRWAWLGALGACGMVADETVVDELRVISIRATPPVLAVSTGGRIDASVVDPQGRTVEVLRWTCTPGPLGCLEAGTAEAPRALSAWTAVGSPDDEEVGWEVAPLEALEAVEAPPPATAWVLACLPGICPILDAVRADPAPGTEAWDAIASDLADVPGALSSLPKRDTSAAFRVVPWVPLPDPSRAPSNPTITPLGAEGEDRTIPSGGRATLRYAVEADAPAVVYPLASEGGFEALSSTVVQGEVEVTLVAGIPDEEGRGAVAPGTEIRLWILAEDEGGGSAIFKDRVQVE